MPKQVDHEQILQYVKNRLYWFGDVSRKEVCRVFQIGSALASRMLGDLRTELPMVPAGKGYVLDPSSAGSPPAGVSSEQFLGSLLMGAIGLADFEKLCGGDVAHWSLDEFRHHARAPVLQAVIHAIRKGMALEIVYVGMKLGEKARKRTIEPIRLAHVGGRWHVDAYCYLVGRRRDFVLSRIREAGDMHHARFGFAKLENEGVNLPKVEALFAPHPMLTPDQIEAVAFEFGMVGNVLALNGYEDQLFYFRKQFVAADGELPPDKLLVELSASSS